MEPNIKVRKNTDLNIFEDDLQSQFLDYNLNIKLKLRIF